MISILCPTRKRPANLTRMVQSVRATCTLPQEIICWVDHDDSSYDAGQFDVTHIVRGPRITHSDYWNALIPHAHGDLYMMCGDDCVFKTPGWDVMVEEAFAACPDKILLVFGDDGCPNGKVFATHPIVHRRWVEVVGYFSGPGFSGDYADAWPQDVADMIGRRKLLPFENEHLHPVWGKAPYDDIYKETNARIHRDKTPQLYASRLSVRQADAEKLRKVMGTPWERQ